MNRPGSRAPRAIAVPAWKEAIGRPAGALVRLALLRAEDAHLVLAWAGDRQVVRNFSFFERRADEERVRAYIREKLASDGDLVLRVHERKGGGYLGNVGLHEIDRTNRTARLGIILRREAWGKGFGQDALRTAIRLAFARLRCHKVFLNVFRTNRRAQRLYRALGFRREGLLREEYRLRGSWIDLVRMGLLRGELAPPPAR